MFQIQISYHATINTLVFQEEEAANVAYEKISTALSGYRMFKNDRSETVEVETDDGRCTYRLERMDSITICKVDKFGPMDRITLEREKMLREMRKEIGLPETTRGGVLPLDLTTDDVSSPLITEKNDG